MNQNIALTAQLALQKLGTYAEAAREQHPTCAKVLSLIHGQLSSLPPEIFQLIVLFSAAAVLILLFLAPMAGFSTYVERRVAARIQARLGCNRVGPEGLLQFMADGIKLITKEDTIPQGADQFLFRLAPYLVCLGAFLSFVCIPFGRHLVVADLDVGIVYLLAISSLVVVGILIAGWASNNKWSLLGSMRSAAQIVSYEIPVTMALLVPVLLAGSLSLQSLNQAQAGGMREWFIFTAWGAPLVAFFIYFIGALAEVNRTPFDLPEAESELVSGYNTEYSGIRWGMFFVGEYANMVLISAIAVTAFLGGWQPTKSNIFFGTLALFYSLIALFKTATYVPKVVAGMIRGRSIFDLLAHVKAARVPKFGFVFLALMALAGATAMHFFFAQTWIVTLLFFVAKIYFFVFVIMWIRWTLPRVRIDQMMSICWQKLVPLAFACIFVTAAFMVR